MDEQPPLDAFSSHVLQTTLLLRRQGFGPPLGTAQLTSRDEQWAKDVSQLLCKYFHQTPVHTSTATQTTFYEVSPATQQTIPSSIHDSLFSSASSSSQELEEPLVHIRGVKRKIISPVPVRTKQVCASTFILPPVPCNLFSRFTDVLIPEEFFDFVMVNRETIIQPKSFNQPQDGLRRFLHLLLESFPNVVYTGDTIKYVPDAVTVKDKLRDHLRVVVILLRDSSNIGLTGLADVVFENSVSTLFDYNGHVKLSSLDVLKRVEDSSKLLPRSPDGSFINTLSVYRIFASLVSLTLPIMAIEKDSERIVRFYARVVESYTQHVNYDHQDCLRFSFAKWV